VIEIGNAYIEIPDFNTPLEFLKSVSAGTIHGKRSGVFVNIFSFGARVKAKLSRRSK
jgi:hypothetical protein